MRPIEDWNCSVRIPEPAAGPLEIAGGLGHRNVSSFGTLGDASRALPRTTLPRTSTSVPQRIRARPRPNRSRTGLPSSGSQNAGVYGKIFRSFPKPAHTHAGSFAD